MCAVGLKSYGDTMQALADLGIDESTARDLGIRLYKVAMSWPLEPQGARNFAQGLEEILVVEEKRQLIEYQIKEELYEWRADQRPPRVVGKFDDNGEWYFAAGRPAGNWLLPAHFELSPAMVARAIVQRLQKLGLTKPLGEERSAAGPRPYIAPAGAWKDQDRKQRADRAGPQREAYISIHAGYSCRCVGAHRRGYGSNRRRNFAG